MITVIVLSTASASMMPIIPGVVPGLCTLRRPVKPARAEVIQGRRYFRNIDAASASTKATSEQAPAMRTVSTRESLTAFSRRDTSF